MAFTVLDEPAGKDSVPLGIYLPVEYLEAYPDSVRVNT